MMTIEEAVSKLIAWHNAGCVGNIWFFRAPRQGKVDGFIEQTIKTHEMPSETAKMWSAQFQSVSSSKVEMFSNKDGMLDRIKVTKSI